MLYVLETYGEKLPKAEINSLWVMAKSQSRPVFPEFL